MENKSLHAGSLSCALFPPRLRGKSVNENDCEHWSIHARKSISDKPSYFIPYILLSSVYRWIIWLLKRDWEVNLNQFMLIYNYNHQENREELTLKWKKTLKLKNNLWNWKTLKLETVWSFSCSILTLLYSLLEWNIPL